MVERRGGGGLTNRNGTWYLRKKINGRLYRVSTGFPVESKATKTSAARRASEIELAIRSGSHGWTKDIPTVRQYWKQTYEPTYTRRKRAPRLDRQIMTHALPHFGHLYLDAVKKSHCEAYLNARRVADRANPGHKAPRRIAEGTVQRERSFLQALFQQAVEDGHIQKNPWRGVAKVAYAVRDRLLTVPEQAELLSRLSPKFVRFVLFLLGTGLRLEECRGINPATDLNLTERSVRVTGKFDKVRQVPIPAVLVPVLETQLADEGGLWQQNQQRLREVLQQACARAGIPHLSPHALRHTFGWRWLTGGGDIYTLSKVLGHGTIAVTERHYAHLLKEDIKAKADRVELGLGLPAATDGSNVLAWKGAVAK